VDHDVDPLLEERDRVMDLRVIRDRVGIALRHVLDEGVPARIDPVAGAALVVW
jgi:hypothetical protein